jgi:hypothetical protein
MRRMVGVGYPTPMDRNTGLIRTDQIGRLRIRGGDVIVELQVGVEDQAIERYHLGLGERVEASGFEDVHVV